MIQNSPNVKRQTRKNRVNFTQEQLEVLEKAFEGNPYPDAVKREDIAKQADLPETRVQVNMKISNDYLNMIKPVCYPVIYTVDKSMHIIPISAQNWQCVCWMFGGAW